MVSRKTDHASSETWVKLQSLSKLGCFCLNSIIKLILLKNQSSLTLGGPVKGFPLKNPQTKKINCPQKELCGGGQQKKRPQTTNDHHFWRLRDKRWGSPIFRHHPLDNPPISQRSGIMHNKARAATLADLTPCANSIEYCCNKTAKVGSIPARRKLKDGFNQPTTNQTMKEDDDKDDNDNEDDKGQRR